MDVLIDVEECENAAHVLKQTSTTAQSEMQSTHYADYYGASTVPGLGEMLDAYASLLGEGEGSAQTVLDSYAEQIDWMGNAMQKTTKMFSSQNDATAASLRGFSGESENVAIPPRPATRYNSFHIAAPAVSTAGATTAKLAGQFRSADVGKMTQLAETWRSLSHKAEQHARDLHGIADRISSTSHGDAVNAAVEKIHEGALHGESFATNAASIAHAVDTLREIHETRRPAVETMERALHVVSNPALYEEMDQRFIHAFLGGVIPSDITTALPGISRLIEADFHSGNQGSDAKISGPSAVNPHAMERAAQGAHSANSPGATSHSRGGVQANSSLHSGQASSGAIGTDGSDVHNAENASRSEKNLNDILEEIAKLAPGGELETDPTSYSTPPELFSHTSAPSSGSGIDSLRGNMTGIGNSSADSAGSLSSLGVKSGWSGDNQLRAAASQSSSFAASDALHGLRSGNASTPSLGTTNPLLGQTSSASAALSPMMGGGIKSSSASSVSGGAGGRRKANTGKLLNNLYASGKAPGKTVHADDSALGSETLSRGIASELSRDTAESNAQRSANGMNRSSFLAPGMAAQGGQGMQGSRGNKKAVRRERRGGILQEWETRENVRALIGSHKVLPGVIGIDC